MALVDELIAELAPDVTIPEGIDKDKLFRGLLAVQEPQEFSPAFYQKQDRYLQEQLRAKGVTKLEDLKPVSDHLYLWQGDITTLEVDGIVNAANSQMLGCFIPNHACIDNAIHSQAGLQLRLAGLQLRLACHQLMTEQGHLEKTGQAKITLGYNLSASYVIHTVGPIIQNDVSPIDEGLLASCYQSCLELALAHKLESLAFCCISTGEFRFPNQLAAEIAVKTVRAFVEEHPQLKIVFNVFKDEDFAIYQQLLVC